MSVYRYGIVRWGVRFDQVFFDPAGYEAMRLSNNEQIPMAIWYRNKEHRDIAIKELARANVGVTFAPVEVSSTVAIAPGELVESTISDKGVLPK